jgi:uncharacterized protein
MGDLIGLSAQVLLSPAILFFLLGLGAALLRSDLSIPEPVAKGMAIYLMVAIGFKGGHEVATYGLSLDMAWAAVLGIVLSFSFPLLAFPLIKKIARLDAVNAAAIGAHYGSVSVVTFVTAVEIYRLAGVAVPGYMVGVMALMETPAILSGLWLAHKARTVQSGLWLAHKARQVNAHDKKTSPKESHAEGSDIWREVLLNGSVVLLIGAFLIALASGQKGYQVLKPLIEVPFKAVLCFFLLDMGLVAARQILASKLLNFRLVVIGLLLPLLGALIGGGAAASLGLPLGVVAIMATLAASASYIAVPAAIRLTLPQANPGLYLTCALAITFPFNVTLGLSLYLGYAQFLTKGLAP